MAAQRIQYQMVGRYMNGKEVTGYHMQSMETGKAGRYTREQVIYLVGRDQVTNCTGQLYQDKVLLRGRGMNIEDLPVQYENGDFKNTENIGKVRRGTSAADAMTQYMITKSITDGRRVVAYEVTNAGGAHKDIPRDDLIRLAGEGRIGNARVQNYNGHVLLRGVNCNLDDLPKALMQGR